MWGVLATQGARRHLPEALDWFKEAGETPLSDEQLAWRARIALRQGNWQEVKTAIERMAPPACNEPTWIYWLGQIAHRARGAGSRDSGFWAAFPAGIISTASLPPKNWGCRS